MGEALRLDDSVIVDPGAHPGQSRYEAATGPRSTATRPSGP
jgi:hypothetical protein